MEDVSTESLLNIQDDTLDDDDNLYLIECEGIGLKISKESQNIYFLMYDMIISASNLKIKK